MASPQSTTSESQASLRGTQTGSVSDTSERTSSPPKPFSARHLPENIFEGTLMVCITIFTVLPIYWGALWKTPAHNLSGWVVDFDGGQIGQSSIRGLQAAPGSRITWTVLPASDFPEGSTQVRDAVLHHKAWIAVTINSGATSNLLRAVSAPNASYDGSEALTVYAEEARSENAFRSLIRPSVQAALQLSTQTFAVEFAKQVASLPSTNLTTLLTVSPQTLITPVSYKLLNLIPFDAPVASTVTFVGMIYLLILSFFMVMICNAARTAGGLERLLTLKSLIILRLSCMIAACFILSLFYSLLSVAFRLPLDRVFGRCGFLVFWMLNWTGMLSVGLALDSLLTVMGPSFLPFFMILWIIANVSVCFLPIDTLPGVFHYGYGFPFYRISTATRTIVFGTKKSLGLDFGVLIAWVVLSCITMSFFQWLVRRRQSRQIERETRPQTETKEA
ncbi:hypothetical protein BD779DRAFT_1530650 [Infundibulicybe gibba]|nr:hypothetical protein BD779DRAFT_1530650 [Infundibulicybe gibba]